MKENNKFSLKAFFCSLGSKSKRSKFVLLGAPFFLVYFLSLKVYANSAVIPVVPEGLTSSGITSSGIVPGDPSLMYYTLLIALGLKADEVYQVNKADLIDSVTDALNNYDSVNDPTLGDDLETFLEWYDNAKSQNGYVNELTIPRELWDRVNKATSSGLNLRINNPSNVSFSSPRDLFDYFASYYDRELTYDSSSADACLRCYNAITNGGSWILIDKPASSGTVHALLFCVDCSYSFSNDVLSIQPLNNDSVYMYAIYSSIGWSVSGQNFSGTSYEVISSSSGTTLNKSIGVARPFISSKANGTYDVLSKASIINDQTGDIEGDVTMSILSYDKIKDIASDYEDSATDIPVFFPDSRLVPIDIENPDAIPDSVGIPGDTPQEIVDSLADTFDPSPAEPIVIEPFNYIDNWDPVIPIAAESPLVGLPFVMNWVAEQMQITMFLSQFSNTWLVLSTLAVASCLVGLVRIWR